MSRTCTLILLVLLVVGCTRYGTNPPGKPFARKLRSDPNAVISPGPSATNSPLALTAPVAPAASHPPEPVGLANGFLGSPRNGEIVPAGGSPSDRNEANEATDAEGFPPRRRPIRSEPPAKQPPVPPKTPNTPAPLPPVSPKTPNAQAPGSSVPADTARHIAEVKKLAEAAAAKWAQVTTYECVVTRRELAPNKDMNEDVVLYQFRKEPMAVFIRNIGATGKGRELIYNPSKHGDKIYVMLGEGDHKLMPAGFKAPPVSPDDPRVKERARYSIREAGYGTPIARVANWVAKAETGQIPSDALTFLGEVQRKEYPYPLLGVQLKLRPGDEPNMPNGGTRQWFFDPKPDSPSYNWPVLIIATEPNGKEVEYYLFEKFKFQVPFTDADFDPARFRKKLGS